MSDATDMQMVPAWVEGALMPVGKLEVHQRGLRHKAVSVFVMAGAQVLIQRRALGKYHTPGLWANTCCTHPHWQETAAGCAVRRLGEELGITGLRPQFSGLVEYRADVGGGLTEHEEVEIFIAEASRDLSVTPNSAEVAEVRWVEIDQLAAEILREPDRFTPWIRIYMDSHRNRIFGKRTANR